MNESQFKGGENMKLVENKSQTSSKLVVTIPKDIVIRLGLKKGDDVIFTLNNKNEIVIKRQRKEN